MNTKKTIRKILFISMWLVICSGMLMLLIAAMGKQKKELCKGYKITIKGERPANFFLDEQAITKLLKVAAKGNIKGQSKAAFDLQEMEQLLEGNVWIKDAQLYFDNKSVLHISVEEREPVARVFTISGRSFYIDNSEQPMPLSDKAITKVPVFTGFPDAKGIKKADSVLLHDINTTAQYIAAHPFWSSQVAQLDIVNDCGEGCWQFEMVPVVGQHIVKLGTGENIPEKFQRLFAFYQQVLNRTGLDHYKIIDVRFSGQVVGAKNNYSKIDSIRAVRKTEDLIQQAVQRSSEDGAEEAQQVRTATQDDGTANAKPAERRTSVVTSDGPKQATATRTSSERNAPKAVMPKR